MLEITNNDYSMEENAENSLTKRIIEFINKRVINNYIESKRLVKNNNTVTEEEFIHEQNRISSSNR